MAERWRSQAARELVAAVRKAGGTVERDRPGEAPGHRAGRYRRRQRARVGDTTGSGPELRRPAGHRTHRTGADVSGRTRYVHRVRGINHHKHVRRKFWRIIQAEASEAVFEVAIRGGMTGEPLGIIRWTAPKPGRYRVTWPWTEPVRLDDGDQQTPR